jgi:hypothetical protein
MEIIYDKSNSIFRVSERYTIDTVPIFNAIGDYHIEEINNIEDVKELTKFQYDSLGLTSNRYLRNWYRISVDNKLFSEWMDLKRVIDNFPEFSSKYSLFVQIKWERIGDSKVGAIKLLDWSLEGNIDRIEITTGEGISIPKGESIIIKAPFIYKVFKINDVEILSTDESALEIKFRYSQDNSKTWSNWLFFTKDNVTGIKINPIRFFQIEYSVQNKSNVSVWVEDINLIGDFQNVTKDYFKSNLFGIRECCKSNVLGGSVDVNGNFIGANSNSITGDSCSTDGSNLPQMTDTEKAQLYNPYAQSTAMNLLNKLSNDAQQVFGFKVIYFATDPDKKGEDKIFNEYQLYNVVCQGEVKVSVEGNTFPDSQIVMNQFDLNLFETMQVHITKQQFKEIFGPQRRPAKEDFLYFCDLNRLFSVDHAQQFRNFNNSAVYYKLVLKKFNKTANVNYANNEVKQTVDKLTKNSTIDELFGEQIKEDKKSIVNDQFKPLSEDPIRLNYYAEISKELIENSTTIISKSHYDLSSVTMGDLAVQYLNMNNNLKKSSNLSFVAWFNINNYIKDEVYHFFSNYDESSKMGIKMHLKNDSIKLLFNETEYKFDLITPANDVNALFEESWYCYTVNINQMERTLEQWVYKRDVDNEEWASRLYSTILRKVYTKKQNLTPQEYYIESSNSSKILGSDMKITNIRLFSDVIPESYHHKLLNQYIIGNDSSHLIFADNANEKLILRRFPYNE